MSVLHRTKIVCTVGPATEDDDILRDMIREGMTVARLNFSHGDHEYHRKNIERVRRIAEELGTNVAIMGDTKGPEIRTRLTRDHVPVQLDKGCRILLTTRDVESHAVEGGDVAAVIALDYLALPREVAPGVAIFMDDGLVELRVEEIQDDENIVCVAVNGGKVGERKGVNIPNVLLSLPAVTEQDRRDIRFACEMQVDAIAASFVRDADAVRQVHDICAEYGQPETMVIAKIESALALDDLENIVRASDGIMVARGDLGVEIPPADVPNVQKDIIGMCNRCYKPVITATQMLESMTHNPRPTRAEVTDVANSIYDGTDCVMLSGETAAGEYPVEAVRMMAEVCARAEARLNSRDTFYEPVGMDKVSGVASFGAVEMAKRVGAKALVCPTRNGLTARIVSSGRPPLPIIATTPEDRTIRRACFYWGVTAIKTTLLDGLDYICYDALKHVRRTGTLERGDLVVITAGDPVTSPLTEGIETSTNVCMIAQVF